MRLDIEYKMIFSYLDGKTDPDCERSWIKLFHFVPVWGKLLVEFKKTLKRNNSSCL